MTDKVLTDLLNEVKSVIASEKIKNAKLDCVSRPEYIDGLERALRIIERHVGKPDKEMPPPLSPYPLTEKEIKELGL